MNKIELELTDEVMGWYKEIKDKEETVFSPLEFDAIKAIDTHIAR